MRSLISASVQDTYKDALSGPEVVREATKVLETISTILPDIDLKIEEHPFGGHAIDTLGEPLPASTLEACQGADAILMGMQRAIFTSL